MRKDYPVIDCDVLVIGGGSAGAMAAELTMPAQHFAIAARFDPPRQRLYVVSTTPFRCNTLNDKNGRISKSIKEDLCLNYFYVR